MIFFYVIKPSHKRVSIDTSILIVLSMNDLRNSFMLVFIQATFIVDLYVEKADVWNIVHYLSPKDDISKENNIKVKT